MFLKITLLVPNEYNYVPVYRMIFVMADFVAAILLRSTGEKLQSGYAQFLRSTKQPNLLETSSKS